MDRLESELRELFLSEGIELLDLSVKGIGARLQIRIIADRKIGGLSIDDCVQLSRQTQYLIAEKKLLPNDYRLEVTSPGLDYPLRESWQFNKNIGRLLKLKVPSGIGTKEIHGRLTDILDDGIELEDGATKWQLRFSDCLSATVLPEINRKPREQSRAKESKR